MGETTYEKHIAAVHKDADVLIFSLQKKITTTEDILLYVEHIKPHLVIVTGFGIKFDEITVLNTVRDIQKKSGVYTVAAKDGMSMNPASYAKNERQKKL